MADNEKNLKSNEKKKFSLRKLFYNDKYLIVFSIVAAVIIWISTSMSFSPETTKTISVPLNIDFSDSAAAQLGLTCYGDSKVDIDVTVSCKKYLARDISSDDIKVSLQTNAVTSKGNYEVPINVSATSENAEFTISSYYPSTYKAYFDVEDEKSFDIELNYETDDFIADGYVMGEPLLSEKTAVVKGPKSYVSKVSRLVANVDFDKKLKETQSVDIIASALDASGSSVDYVSVDTGSENLNLTVPVLKKTTLPITSSFSGAPEGTDTSSFTVKYSVDSIDAAILEDSGIKEANIGSIDFSRLNVGKNTFKFDVTTLDGITVLDKTKTVTATVTVPSDYSTKTVSVNKSSVNIANIPDGYEASVISINASSLTLIGTQTELEKDGIGVGLVVDLSAYQNKLEPGSSYYDITANIEGTNACWVYGKYQAQIEITKK